MTNAAEQPVVTAEKDVPPAPVPAPKYTGWFRIYRYTSLPARTGIDPMHYALEYVGGGYPLKPDLDAGLTPEQSAVLYRIRLVGPLPEGQYIALPDVWPLAVTVKPETQEVAVYGHETVTWTAGEPRVPNSSPGWAPKP